MVLSLLENDCRLIGMLLVSRFGLVEENTVEVFHHYDVRLCSSLDEKFQIFSGEKNIMG